jgi:MFS family permease
MTASSGAVTGLAGYRRALTYSPFRRLLVAAVVSRAGDAINFVALPLFAYATTGSPAAVASLVIIEGAALVIGGSAAQFVVDRTPPRRLLVAVDIGRALAAAALALEPKFSVALVVAAVLALGTSWFSPTSGALIPRLVDDEVVPSANALQWTAGVALQLIAAPVGGLLFTAASARIAFAVNAVSFVISAVILADLPAQRALAAATGPWRQLPEALRAVATVPVLAPLLVMQGLAALAVGATSALLVVLAESAYGLGGTGYGAWLAVVGLGALVGPLVVPLVARVDPRRTVPGAYVVRGVGDVGLGLLGNGAAGGAFLFVYGLNTSSGTVSFQTLVQKAVPAGLRGRAFALLDVVWQSGRLISIAIGGALASLVGIRALFVAGGCLLLLAGALGLATLRVGSSDPRPASKSAGG